MNRINIHQDQQAWEETLSDAEIWELLSLRGVAVSRVAEILGKKTQAISSMLKSIQSRKYFTEADPQGTTRIIVLTSAWVRELLERARPPVSKTTTVPKNVSILKPRESGMLFDGFKNELLKINPSDNPKAIAVWKYLTQKHLGLFRMATPKGGQKPVYELRKENKEKAIELAQAYIQRVNANVSAHRKHKQAIG